MLSSEVGKQFRFKGYLDSNTIRWILLKSKKINNAVSKALIQISIFNLPTSVAQPYGLGPAAIKVIMWKFWYPQRK